MLIIGLSLIEQSHARTPPSTGKKITTLSAQNRSPQANDILFRAMSLVGTRYRYGGNTPQTGFDCSGLVSYVFRDAKGINLPRSATDMSRLNYPTIPRQRLVAGDLVFFSQRGHTIGHVGIYVGEGRFIHAPSTGGKVRLDKLDDKYWRKHYRLAKRIPLGAPNKSKK